MQKKEMLLAKLRRELLIPDQRHEKMREMIQHGVELRERSGVLSHRPWKCLFLFWFHAKPYAAQTIPPTGFDHFKVRMHQSKVIGLLN